jgi:hypothetical protein
MKSNAKGLAEISALPNVNLASENENGLVAFIEGD